MWYKLCIYRVMEDIENFPLFWMRHQKLPSNFFFLFFFFKYLFFYLWLCWVFVSVQGLSLVVASGGHSWWRSAGLSLSRPLVAEHRLQTRRLSSCGSRAELLRGMWGLPRPGLEPASPALAGRFSTTAPPGKPCNGFFKLKYISKGWKEEIKTVAIIFITVRDQCSKDIKWNKILKGNS